MIYISSDELMECMSNASVDDLYSLSHDDEKALLALCVERQMEHPATTESVPVPSCKDTQWLTHGGYFDLGMGGGPVARDQRLRNDHPIIICRQLIPMVDTPSSPPAVEKYPTGDRRAVAKTTSSTSQVGPSTIHFRGPNVDNNPYITGCTDCLICGKSVEQIQDEAVFGYLHKTAVRGEAVEQFDARRLAFLEGMKVGCFMQIPGGVSQAFACDGIQYSFCHDWKKALPNTVPLK